MTSPAGPRRARRPRRLRWLPQLRCYRPLTGLLAANVVSVLGGAMSLIALPWFVFGSTGSAALTGIAAACETVPVVAVSIVAGRVVSRVGARRTRAWSDLAAGITVMTVPLLHATVGVAYWQLLMLVAVNGALRTPAVAASMVMLRHVTTLAGLTPDQTVGPYSASVRLAATMGAPAAGALIALTSAPSVLVLDAASFLISAALVWLLIPEPVRERSSPGPAKPQGGAAEVTAGFAVLRGDPMLRTLTVIAVVLAAMTAGWNSVGAPIYGKTVLGSAVDLGVILGVFGVGALVGNVAYAPLTRRRSCYTVLITALSCTGPLPWIALAVHPPLPLLLPLMTIAGAGLGLLGPLYATLQYDRASHANQAQLFGVTFGLQTGGEAFGAALAGFTFTYLPIQQTLLGMSGITATLILTALLAPSLQTLRNAEPGSP